MVDAFSELGLPRAVVLDAAAVRERFLERGRVLHPDGGTAPDPEAFERANRAAALLEEPGKRLRHFLDLQFGPAPEHSGAIAPVLMDLFGDVGEAVRAADAAAAKKNAARSAIAQALLTREVTGAQGLLVAAGEKVRAAIAACEARLPEVDAGASREAGEELYREFAFLEKWRRQVQEKFAGLF